MTTVARGNQDGCDRLESTAWIRGCCVPTASVTIDTTGGATPRLLSTCDAEGGLSGCSYLAALQPAAVATGWRGGTDRCDLTRCSEWVCPTTGQHRASVRVFCASLVWRNALVAGLTYQSLGGHHGRLYAFARFLLLASGHALRPLDGEKAQLGVRLW